MDYSKLGYKPAELVRDHPSSQVISLRTKRHMQKSYLPLLEELTTKAIAPYDIAERIQEFAVEHGCVAQDERTLRPVNGSSIAVIERDHNAFCLIHPGDKGYDFSKGINILVAHTDTPNLRVRVQPTWFESHTEKKFSFHGPYLEIAPNGGIQASDWVGKNGFLHGRAYMKNEEHRVTRLPARIPHSSIHLEIDSEEENTFDRVRIFTGATSVAQLYSQLGIRNESDFGSAEFYFYPNTPLIMLGEEYVSAYGLDDRSLIAATTFAFLESKPRTPTFVFGLDGEEIGSTGASGRVNGFFSNVLSSYISQRMGFDRPLTLEEMYNKGILGTIPAICADVGPLPGYNEDDLRHVTNLETAKAGFGPFICPSWGTSEGNSVSAKQIHYIQRAFESAVGKRYQFVGFEFKSAHAYEAVSHFAQYFTNKYVPMVAAGVAVADLHRPSGELMHVWDFLRTIQGYKGYIMQGHK